MSWHWFLFIIVILFGNFLMIGAQIIGLANTTGVLLCGERSQQLGKSKPLFGIVVSTVFQSIAAITISALIVTWVRFITDGESKSIFAWIVGGIAAVFPIWQALRLSNYERLSEPESYIAKGATHRALPFALLLTIIATILFIVVPGFLDSVFYGLLFVGGFVAILSIVSMILVYRGIKSEASANQKIEEMDSEMNLDDENVIRAIEHLQKMLAYQQLAMERVNDAFAKVTGTGAPTNEAFIRPATTLFDEASVEEHIMPALYEKAKILSTMESEHYSMEQPKSEWVRTAFNHFDVALEAMRNRSDIQIHGFTEWLSGKSDHVDVTKEDSTEMQMMDKALMSLNLAIQNVGIDAEGFLGILRSAFNDVRQTENLRPLGEVEFSELYIGGLAGKPARFFSE